MKNNNGTKNKYNNKTKAVSLQTYYTFSLLFLISINLNKLKIESKKQKRYSASWAHITRVPYNMANVL